MAIKLDIRPTPGDVALAAAEMIRREAHKAVRARGCFLLALAGGRTPNLLYEMLAREPFAGTMPWEQTHIFWGDERCVPMAHQDSNSGTAMKHLLSKVPVPALILTGAHDSLVPMRRLEFMAEMMPFAELQVIAGAGHFPSIETPQAINAVLRGFLPGPMLLR